MQDTILSLAFSMLVAGALVTAGCPDIVVPPMGGCLADSECDVGTSCQTASCVAGLCELEINDGWCLVDGECYVSGQGPASDRCQICNPSITNTGLMTQDCGSETCEPTTGLCPELTTPTCEAYCTSVMSACTGSDAQYKSAAACLIYCDTHAALPIGTLEDMNGNTVGCRMYQATVALESPEVHCPRAGPSGGGACGGWCENYCHLALKNCTDAWALYSDADTCATTCAELSTSGGANDMTGDTVQCRITYLALVGDDVSGADTQCPAADVPSTTCQVTGLVVNEVDYAAPEGHRFVEIYNPTSQPIATQGYRLAWTDGEGNEVLVSDSGSTFPQLYLASLKALAPGGFAVVGENDITGPLGATSIPYKVIRLTGDVIGSVITLSKLSAGYTSQVVLGPGTSLGDDTDLSLSFSRCPDGGISAQSTTPTPGSANLCQ